MAIRSTGVQGAQSTLDERFTTRTIVDLFAVGSRGYRVKCDMWHEERHDHWSKEHGLFANKAVAERKRDEIAATFVQQGYRCTPSGYFCRGYHEAYVEVTVLEIEPENIDVDDLGKYSYKGRAVIL